MNIEKTLIRALYIALYPVLFITTGVEIGCGSMLNDTNRLKGGIIATIAVAILFIIDGFGPFKEVIVKLKEFKKISKESNNCV